MVWFGLECVIQQPLVQWYVQVHPISSLFAQCFGVGGQLGWMESVSVRAKARPHKGI